MDSLTKLQYYRAETRHEYSLLGQCVSWYVTCQSFLIIAFPEWEIQISILGWAYV